MSNTSQMVQGLLRSIESQDRGSLTDPNNGPWWTENPLELKATNHVFFAVVDEVRPGTILMDVRHCKSKAPPQLKRHFQWKKEALVSVCVDGTPEQAIETFAGRRVPGFDKLADLPVPRQIMTVDPQILFDRLDELSLGWGLRGWVSFLRPDIYEQIPMDLFEQLGLRIKITPVGVAVRRKRATQ